MTYGHDTLFKALDGRISPVAGYRYPIGSWTKHLDPATIALCRVGYHLARGPMVLEHLRSDLYAAEACPEHGLAEHPLHLLTCRTRLTRVSTWDERVARLFAADCAEAALLGEQACRRGTDVRSRAAVEAARRYADRLIGDDDLADTEAAARNVSLVAGPPADAAFWAAEAAVAATVRTTAQNAARFAVAAAATEAEAATEAAARPAAWSAAWAAAESTMFDRLLLYLNEQPLPPVEPLYGPPADAPFKALRMER